MKNKTITVFYTCCFFLCIFFACKKDALPKATQNGANTFGCKINGVVFEPCKDEGLFTSPSLFASLSVGTITSVMILAKCTQTNPYKYIIITLGDFHGTGVYSLSDNQNNICQYQEPDPFPGKYYSSFYTKSGEVTISKYDRTNYILSGSFEFTAANQDSTVDVVTITDGRFDISYK